MHSDKVKAAVSVLMDEGYELNEQVYYRLEDLERKMKEKGEFYLGSTLAKEYDQLYHDDLKRAVFYCRQSRNEKSE